MAKRNAQQPMVRKPLLIGGAAAIALALVVVVVSLVTAGGGAPPQAPAPPQGSPEAGASEVSPRTPVTEPTLRPGGRDPFRPVVNIQAAPAPAPQPTPTPVPEPSPVPATGEGSRYVELVRAGKCQALPTAEPHTLEEVIAHQNECLAANPG
jgi:hypothetical protein